MSDTPILRGLGLMDPWPEQPDAAFRFGGIPGIESAIPRLRSGLITVEGQTKVGKTWFTVNMAMHFARENYVVAILGHEGEGHVEYRDRFRGLLASIDWTLAGSHPKEREQDISDRMRAIRIAMGVGAHGSYGAEPCAETVFERVDTCIDRIDAGDAMAVDTRVLYTRPRHPDDGHKAVAEAQALATRLNARGVVLVLDAIQDIRTPDEPRERWQQIEQRADYWEALAQREGILVIGSSQSNRQGGARGSGNIEFKAAARIVLRRGFDDAKHAEKVQGFAVESLPAGAWPFATADAWSTQYRDNLGLPRLWYPVKVSVPGTRRAWSQDLLFAFSGSTGSIVDPCTIGPHLEGF